MIQYFSNGIKYHSYNVYTGSSLPGSNFSYTAPANGFSIVNIQVYVNNTNSATIFINSRVVGQFGSSSSMGVYLGNSVMVPGGQTFVFQPNGPYYPTAYEIQITEYTVQG